MNPVVHFEMPAKDRKRVIEFYSKTFGWQMQQLDEKMSNYILAGTTETDEKGMVKTPGTINGGFYETKKKEAPHLVISVDDLNKHMEMVKKAGGKILDKPMEIQGIGMFVMFTDTEGNKVGMLQPTQM